MTLINPWLLSGLAALAVPVLVHMVLREEHSGTKFPSLMFVSRIPFELKRRRRIRDRVLLALRCLALAAVVIAFAAPDVRSSLPGSASAGQRHVVILVDRSYSMSPPRRWQRATDAARARIDGLGPGERAALVAFDDDARLITGLTDDKALLRAALQELEPGEAKTGYASAFGAANHILARDSAGQNEVVLITDLQRSALDDTGVLPLGEEVLLNVVAVTDSVGANAAIIDARLAPQRDGRVEDSLRVRVENTGDAPLEAGRIELAVDGRVTETRPLALAAGEARTLTLPLVLAAERPTRVAVSVGPDSLPADNRYLTVLAPRRPVAVAILEPAHPRAGMGVFLEQALRLSRAPPVSIRRLALDEVNQAALAGFDVVVLDDLAVPPGIARDALGGFVDRGGGVLAAAGPETGAAWPGGDGGLLPKLQGPELTHANGGGRIEAAMLDHPLWAAAGLERGQGLAGFRVDVSHGLVPAPDDRVLARLENGAPLLVERRYGAGRALALATTADPRWTNLALEPGFVPFAQAAVAYLAGRSAWIDSYLAGDVVDLARLAGHLPGGADWRSHIAGGGALVVEAPAGVAHRVEHSGRALFRTRLAGSHEVHRADGRGAPLPFAVNVSRTESLLTAASPADLEGRVVRRSRSAILRSDATAGADDTDPFGAARRLLMLAGLALILESILAARLTRRAGSFAAGARP